MGRHAARHSCPFCDHYCTDMRASPQRMPKVGFTAYVRCCSCDAFGPLVKYCRSRAEAISKATAAWNKRPIARMDEAGNRIGAEALTLLDGAH